MAYSETQVSEKKVLLIKMRVNCFRTCTLKTDMFATTVRHIATRGSAIPIRHNVNNCGDPLRRGQKIFVFGPTNNSVTSGATAEKMETGLLHVNLKISFAEHYR